MERQQYCLSIIKILRRRCASLNQWLEQVIETVLIKDYSLAKIEYDKKSRYLKIEKFR